MSTRSLSLVVAAGLLALGGALAAAEDIARGCMDCHGQDGLSTEPDVPVIAGYSAQYIIDSMIAYREGERPATESKYRHGDTSRAPTDMKAIADKLGEADTEAAAKFFAAREFVPRKQTFDAAKAARGAKIHDDECEKCHEDGGTVAEDDAGILGGQWMKYLEHAFSEYASGKRSMPKKMQPKMDKLDAADVEALIHYYGSLQ